MAQRTDVIRRDIEDTRAAMTVKLAMLEGHVLETVTSTQAAVEKIIKDVRSTVEDASSTVENASSTVKYAGGIVTDVGRMVTDVKATVDATLAAVKHTCNVPAQVQQHPWLMVGGAVLGGYLFGRRGGGRTTATGSTRGTPGAAAGVLTQGAVEASRPVASPASPARRQPQPGIVSGVLEQLKDSMQHEITHLTSAALGAAITMLHEMFKPAIATVAARSENPQPQPGAPAGYSPEPHSAAMSGAAHNGVPS